VVCFWLASGRPSKTGRGPLTDLLFVYGTLQRASRHPMARRLARESVWLGRATLNGKLHLPGPYPGAVLSSGRRDAVHGDVVRLPQPRAALAWLDDFEGCGTKRPEPPPYRRATVTVRMVSGEQRQAWAYLYELRVWCTRILPDGRFPAG
jgi:gamma-glutamylcyclotransferase (GGCT)/AIG2-like uncharacterized protein YtfP